MDGEGTPLHGDRGAWATTDFPEEHARDINDAALLYHLPLPADAGEIAQSDGSNWSATTTPSFPGIVTFEVKTVFDAPLFIKEAAAAEADVAGYGQLWVKTATPNQLWFTDDAGNDVVGFYLGAIALTGASTISTTAGNLTIDSAGLFVIQDATVIDITSTEALLVRKNADGGDIFTVDTTNSVVEIGTILDIPTTASASVGVITQNGSRIFHTYGTDNLFFGLTSGNVTLTTANDCVGMGRDSLLALTTGDFNVGVGRESLGATTTGQSNAAIGYYSLRQNVSGSANMAFGAYALENCTASYNVGIGNAALRATTSGSSNLALGRFAMNQNTTGLDCVCVGSLAMEEHLDGRENVAIGFYAARFQRSGIRNVVIGSWAGYGVTTNSYSNNVLIGDRTAQRVTTGSNNTVIGFWTGREITTGANNILLGYKAGDLITTGDDNIIIGYDIDPSAAGVSDELNIGNLIKGYLAAHASGPAINLMGGTPQAQQAHIVDADGTLADITTKFNTLLADLEGYGLLAAA